MWSFHYIVHSTIGLIVFISVVVLAALILVVAILSCKQYIPCCGHRAAQAKTRASRALSWKEEVEIIMEQSLLDQREKHSAREQSAINGAVDGNLSTPQPKRASSIAPGSDRQSSFISISSSGGNIKRRMSLSIGREKGPVGANRLDDSIVAVALAKVRELDEEQEAAKLMRRRSSDKPSIYSRRSKDASAVPFEFDYSDKVPVKKVVLESQVIQPPSRTNSLRGILASSASNSLKGMEGGVGGGDSFRDNPSHGTNSITKSFRDGKMSQSFVSELGASGRLSASKPTAVSTSVPVPLTVESPTIVSSTPPTVKGGKESGQMQEQQEGDSLLFTPPLPSALLRLFSNLRTPSSRTSGDFNAAGNGAAGNGGDVGRGSSSGENAWRFSFLSTAEPSAEDGSSRVSAAAEQNTNSPSISSLTKLKSFFRANSDKQVCPSPFGEGSSRKYPSGGANSDDEAESTDYVSNKSAKVKTLFPASPSSSTKARMEQQRNAHTWLEEGEDGMLPGLNEESAEDSSHNNSHDHGYAYDQRPKVNNVQQQPDSQEPRALARASSYNEDIMEVVDMV